MMHQQNVVVQACDQACDRPLRSRSSRREDESSPGGGGGGVKVRTLNLERVFRNMHKRIFLTTQLTEPIIFVFQNYFEVSFEL